MENTNPKEILENIINVMEKTNVDEWEIDKLVVVLNYINELEKENKLLKETKLANQFSIPHCAEIKINTYEDRIDKAIEYIKGTHFYGSRTNGKSLFNEYFNELLNILRGEDNDK